MRLRRRKAISVTIMKSGTMAFIKRSRDALRHVVCPSFGRIERDDAKRTVILSGDQVADNRIPISFGRVSLNIGCAVLAESWHGTRGGISEPLQVTTERWLEHVTTINLWGSPCPYNELLQLLESKPTTHESQKK